MEEATKVKCLLIHPATTDGEYAALSAEKFRVEGAGVVLENVTHSYDSSGDEMLWTGKNTVYVPLMNVAFVEQWEH